MKTHKTHFMFVGQSEMLLVTILFHFSFASRRFEVEMIRTLPGGLLPTSLSDVAVGLLMFVSLSIFKIFCIDHRSRGRETSMKFNFFGSSQIHIPTSKTNSILKSGIRMFSRKKIAEKFIIHETSRTRE